MNNTSYWQKTAQHIINPSLQQDLKTDIAIIGGGLTGVMCAYYLRNTGRKITVFEQDTIGCQTSGHTTAKITYLHTTIYQFLIKYYGKEFASLYLESNKQAISAIERIINEESIQCEYQRNNAYVYTKDSTNSKYIEKEIEALRALGIEPLVDEHQDKEILKSVGVKGQAVFHPLKYLYAIVEACKRSGVVFHENSQATNFDSRNLENTFICNGKNVECTHLVLATRYPQINFPKLYFLKLSQSRDHLVYGRGNTIMQDSYLSIDDPVETFRCVNTGNIYGGYSHDVGLVHDLEDEIISKAKNHFTSTENVLWSAQDTKTNRGIPYIGYFNSEDENRYIACGYNKWGMTLSHVSAKLIYDLITHQDNPYKSLYSPGYTNIAASKKDWGKLIKSTFKGMVSNRFLTKNGKIENGNGKVVRIHGKLIGIYKDENNHLHMVNPHCRHLQCVLSFNALEKTWDCPCHGSRYDIDGLLLEGPATESLKSIKNNKR